MSNQVSIWQPTSTTVAHISYVNDIVIIGVNINVFYENRQRFLQVDTISISTKKSHSANIHSVIH